MHISQTGLDLIEGFEGLYLTTYIDPVGVPTIGYGHTGADVTPGRTITEAEANQILADDLTGHEDAVQSHVTVPLEQYQFDALVSFAFNVGDGAFAGSTLLKKLNAGDYDGAADQFLVWNKGTVDGQKVELPGLTRRRKSERHLFLTGKLDFYDGQGERAGGNAASTTDTTATATSTSSSASPTPTPEPVPDPDPVADPPAPSGHDYANALGKLLTAWGVKNFSAAELMELGDSNATPGSPAYGTNTLPPVSLWKNMKLTIQVLDRLREVLGEPVHILSAYRNATYNALVGGVPDSLHIQFNAIDFYVGGSTRPAHWAAVLKDMRVNGDFKGGIGVYSSYVHVDTRGENADW